LGQEWRFYSKGVQGELLDVVWKRLAFLENIPVAVEEGVSSRRDAEWRKRGPASTLGKIAEDPIKDSEGGFQVRVVLVVLPAHDGVSTRGGLEHRLVGFVADALVLNGEVEESLGAEVCLVLEFGDNHSTD
jgi:hypothetical protein